MARTPGLNCGEWLRDWAERHIKPEKRVGEKRARSVTQALAEALPRGREAGDVGRRDDSGVTKMFAGVTGINPEQWQTALTTLRASGELTATGFDEFISLCEQTKAGKSAGSRVLVDFFKPIESRLAVRLERGANPEKSVKRAYSEASGLLASWLLTDRRFRFEDIKDGLDGLFALVDRWEKVLADVTEELPEEREIGEGLWGNAHKDKLRFLYRLFTWAPRSCSAPPDDLAPVLRKIKLQLCIEGEHDDEDEAAQC